MEFYSRQTPSRMSRVYNLFRGLSGLTADDILHSESRFTDYSHTTEIIDSALNGNIDFEDFNLKAYEVRCSQREKINVVNKAKKEKSLVYHDTSEDYDSLKRQYGTVDAGSIRVEEDGYQTRIEEIDFESALKKLYALRDELIVEESVDIIRVLKSALKQFNPAQKILAGLCERSERVSDIISDLLSFKVDVLPLLQA